MSDFRARLFEEHAQLQKRRDDLGKFLMGENLTKLSEVDQKDLREQYTHMDKYFDVLNRRVSRACNNA